MIAPSFTTKAKKSMKGKRQYESKRIRMHRRRNINGYAIRVYSLLR